MLETKKIGNHLKQFMHLFKITETSGKSNIHPVQETTMIPAGGFGTFFIFINLPLRFFIELLYYIDNNPINKDDMMNYLLRRNG